MDDVYRRKIRSGLLVFVGLLVLDLVEFAVGAGMRSGALVPLALLGVASAWLILRFYMHIAQLRRGGEL